MRNLWEHLQEMDRMRVELDMYQRMDIEAIEWAVRRISALQEVVKGYERDLAKEE